MKETSTEKLKFLSDKPNVTDELGSHEPIAKTIVQIIRSHEEKPYVIGLFGSWGSGKSTIVEILKNNYSQEIRFVIIDAWRKDQDNFIRQFIKKLARTLLVGQEEKQKNVIKKIDEKIISQEGGIKNDKADTGFSVAITCLVAVVGIVIWSWILKTILAPDGNIYLDIFDLSKTLMPLIIGALTLSLVHWYLPKHQTSYTISTQDQNLDDPHRFREIYYEDIIGHCDAKNICIVIDNLDRVAPDDAFKIIKTIKTFIVDQEETKAEEKVVFLIPCDDTELSNHLKKDKESHIKNPTEFLRKFFNVTLRIPTPIPNDLYSLALAELNSTGLTDDEDALQNVASMMNAGLSDNPRQSKQFINQLLAKYLQIVELERAGLLNIGQLSKSIEAIAFYMLVENEFKKRISTEEYPKKLLPDFSELNQHYERTDSPIWPFLRKTSWFWDSNNKKINPSLWATLQHLKEPNIPNYNQTRDAVLERRIEDLRTLLSGQDSFKILNAIYELQVDTRQKVFTIFAILNIYKDATTPIPFKLKNQIQQFVADNIFSCTGLPAKTLYQAVLKDSDRLTTVLEKILGNGTRPDDEKVWIEEPGLSFSIDLTKEILKEEKQNRPLRLCSSIITKYSFKHVEYICLGLNSSINLELKFFEALQASYSENKERLSSKKILSSLSRVSGGNNLDAISILIQILQVQITSSKNANQEMHASEKELIKELLSSILNNNITVGDKGMVQLLNALSSHYSAINGWSGKSDDLSLIGKMTEMVYCQNASAHAKTFLQSNLSYMLINAPVNITLDFISHNHDLIEQYGSNHLSQVAARDPFLMIQILNLFKNFRVQIIKAHFLSRYTWIREWLAQNKQSLSFEERRDIQNCLLTISVDNNYPEYVYEAISLIVDRRYNKLNKLQEDHFEEMLRRLNPANYNNLDRIYRLMIMAKYKPMDAQASKLKESALKVASLINQDQRDRLKQFEYQIFE